MVFLQPEKEKSHLIGEFLDASFVLAHSLDCFAALLLLRLHLIFKFSHLKGKTPPTFLAL